MRRVFSNRRGQYLIRLSIFLLIAVLVTGIAGCTDGSYTPSEDLEIRDWYDLDAVRDNLAGHHILMNDLDSTTLGYDELASPTADGGKGWEPIPVPMPEGPGFMGTFDGQGHEIRDLFVNRPDQNGVGLFSGQVGVIKDLGVMNVTVTGARGVGGLAGSNTGSIINCYCSGNVTGEVDAGGLIGYNGAGGMVSNSYSIGGATGVSSVGGLVGYNNGSIDNCYSTSRPIGGDSIGGLVGTNSEGTINDSHSAGTVSGTSDVGGLVGANGESIHTGTVSSSYSTGNVTGHEHVGGLAGTNPGMVSNSYSIGGATGVSSVGGLVGYNNGSIDKCYSAGAVTGSSEVGGLVGQNPGVSIVNRCFWDIETSGQTASGGGTGQNTTEMQDIVTFSGVGWDIITVALNETNLAYIWNIVAGVTYPFLSWQSTE
jgi:hypothetical protein